MIVRAARSGALADWALAQRCAAGDRAAQRQLFDEQRTRVHLVLYRILGSNYEIEDLVQEAFVRIFRSLGRYRGEASLSTWVDRITARTAFRYLSSRPTQAVRLELLSSAADAVPEEELQLRDIARRLYAVLDRLAPKYRIAYTLHAIDERPLSEVAEITDVSVVAAKSRVWRARRMLKRLARSDQVLNEFLAGRRRSAR